MCLLATMCIWLWLTLFSCQARVDATEIDAGKARLDATEIDAKQVLYPPYNYWLKNRSAGADTSFTGNMPCTQLDYMEYEHASDLVTLSTRNNKASDWNMTMFEASVSTEDKAVLTYKTFDPEYEESIVTVQYTALYISQNYCYIVEKAQQDQAATEIGAKEKSKCELWVVTEKDRDRKDSTPNKAKMSDCLSKFESLCSAGEEVYSRDICEDT
uniref:Putative secreted protein n=1 Tax=Amblyomma triste TaxID=251400 RepID=A0A023G5F0_AMBTT